MLLSSNKKSAWIENLDLLIFEVYTTEGEMRVFNGRQPYLVSNYHAV
jgi:hypothetical protein